MQILNTALFFRSHTAVALKHFSTPQGLKEAFLWSHFEPGELSGGIKVEHEKDSGTSSANKPLPSRPECPPCCEPFYGGKKTSLARL